jgi:WD40 repeat protein
MQHEVMVYDSKVTGIAFSKCGKFMASVYLNGKLVIFNIERGDCKPVNNKEIESPHQIYAGLDFSPDGAYLANIGTNSSMITIWETKNFSLRW